MYLAAEDQEQLQEGGGTARGCGRVASICGKEHCKQRESILKKTNKKNQETPEAVLGVVGMEAP